MVPGHVLLQVPMNRRRCHCWEGACGRGETLSVLVWLAGWCFFGLVGGLERKHSVFGLGCVDSYSPGLSHGRCVGV